MNWQDWTSQTRTLRSARHGLVRLNVLLMLGVVGAALALMLTTLLSTSHAATVGPADTVDVSVLADGTHDGPGTETFVRTDNGFAIGDDTATDGVVSSGDVVQFKLHLGILAGPARTMQLHFDLTKMPWLEANDFAQLNLDSNIITNSSYDSDTGTLTFSVVKGGAGDVNRTISIRAKDTKGTVQPGNLLQATLTRTVTTTASDGSTTTQDVTLASSKTKEVTVVSAPMADLTLDTDSDTDHPDIFVKGTSTDQQRTTRMLILPRVLHPEGYSTNGLTSAGPWSTDINVDSFPDGTTFTLQQVKQDEGSNPATYSPVGDATPLTVTTVDGHKVLKDVSGTGPYQISYTIPQGALTADNPLMTMTAALNVHADSFSVGTMTNIPDPGNGKPIDYDTSTYTYKVGNSSTPISVGAVTGRYPAANNNYTSTTFRFAGDGLLDSRMHAPVDKSATTWESGNTTWPSGTTDVLNVKRRDISTTSNPVTSGNEVFHRLTLRVDLYRDKGASSGTDLNQFVVTHKLNTATGQNGNTVTPEYDTTQMVRVHATVQGKDVAISPANYHVEWFDANGKSMGTSLKPLQGAASAKIVLDKATFFPDDNTTQLEVAMPMHINDSYSAHTQGTDSINYTYENQNFTSTYSVQSNITDTADTTTAGGLLIFPQKPEPQTTVSWGTTQPQGDAMLLPGTVSTRVNSTPTSSLSNITTTLTFDKYVDLRDPANFVLTQANGWQVDHIDNSDTNAPKVVLRYVGTNGDTRLHMDSLTAGTYPDFSFTVPSYPRIVDAQTTVTSDLSLSYPYINDALAGGTVTANSNASEPIDGNVALSAVLKTDTPHVEKNEPITWSGSFSAGAVNNVSVSQVVVLPYGTGADQGDAVQWNAFNTMNPSSTVNVDATTNTDSNQNYEGPASTRLSGTYKMTTLKLSDTNFANTSVEFFSDAAHTQSLGVVKPDAQGNVQVPDGAVSFIITTGTPEIDGQSAGAHFTMTILPNGNHASDTYMAWLGPTTATTDKGNQETIIGWPDYADVVMSSLKGAVYRDNNYSATYDPGETGYKGVTVMLLCPSTSSSTNSSTGTSADSCNATWQEHGSPAMPAAIDQSRFPSSQWHYIATTTTANDQTGSYVFTDLHSGPYTVVLPYTHTTYDASKNSRTPLVTSITNPSQTGVEPTSSTAADGDLRVFKTNLYGVDRYTEQTQSYQSTMSASQTFANGTVPFEDDLQHVNFGFVIPEDKLALDKSPATVNSSNHTVQWKVTIQNTGNVPVDQISLGDRMSSEVTNVTTDAQLSNSMSNIIVISGQVPDLRGSLIANSSGAWYGAPNVTGTSKTGTGKMTTYTKVEGITGTPTFVNADEPLNYGLICTTVGCWFVNHNHDAIRLPNVSGTPINHYTDRFGSALCTSTNPLSDATCTGNKGLHKTTYIATNDGLWYVKASDDGMSVTVQEVKDDQGNSFASRITDITGNALYGLYWIVADGHVYQLDGTAGSTRATTAIPYTMTNSATGGAITDRVVKIISKGTSPTLTWSSQYTYNSTSAFGEVTIPPVVTMMTAKGQVYSSEYTGGNVLQTTTMSMRALGSVAFKASSSVIFSDSDNPNFSTVIATDSGTWFTTQEVQGTPMSLKKINSMTKRVTQMYGRGGAHLGTLLVTSDGQAYAGPFQKQPTNDTTYARDLISSTSAGGVSVFNNRVTDYAIYGITNGELYTNYASPTKSTYSTPYGDGYITGTFVRAGSQQFMGNSSYTGWNMIETTTGLWGYNVNNRTSHVDPSSFGISDFGSVIAYNGSGPYPQASNYGGDMLIATTTDIYQIRNVSKISSPFPGYIQKLSTTDPNPAQGFALVSQSTESNTQSRSFDRRMYSVPELNPGQSITVTFTGTYDVRTAAYVIGNQAWTTSAITPRAGLEGRSNGSGGTLYVIGTRDSAADKSAGVPDMPLLPDTTSVKTNGIEHTDSNAAVGSAGSYDTVTLNMLDDNSNVREATMNTTSPYALTMLDTSAIDDLADQTPALIPAGTPGVLLGQAWYDTDAAGSVTADGLYGGAGSTDTPVPQLTVQVLDSNYNVVKTTTTDDTGHWRVDGLDGGQQYYVHYVIAGWTTKDANGKTVYWSATKRDVQNSSNPINSDIDATGFVSKLLTPLNPNDTAALAAYHEADAGLQTQPAALTVIKGLKADDEPTVHIHGDVPLDSTTPSLRTDIDMWSTPDSNESNHVSDMENPDSPKTQAFTYQVVNTGNSPLIHVGIKDATTQGLPASLQVWGWISPATVADSATSANGVTPGEPTSPASDSVASTSACSTAGDTTARWVKYDPVTGVFVENSTQRCEVVLLPGQQITSVFQIGFNSGNDTHADTITGTAQSFQVDADNNVIPVQQLSDQDKFSADYVYNIATYQMPLTGSLAALAVAVAMLALMALAYSQLRSRKTVRMAHSNGTITSTTSDTGIAKCVDKKCVDNTQHEDGGSHEKA